MTTTTTMNMQQPLTLRNGHMRCEVLPALGGCLSGLWLGEWPVLRSASAQNIRSVRESGSYPLVPYSNRIGFARMQWDGVEYALTPNFAPEPHAIHGVGWERAWEVDHAGTEPNSATLTYQHQPDDSWPFAFEARQTLRLGLERLDMTLEITNTHTHDAPAGLGWHPYFTKRPDTRVQFRSAGRWEMDADKLPTRRLESAGLDTDCQQLVVDHCFDGWEGSVTLRSGLREVRVTSDLGYLVVFTNPARDNIAVEPVSHVNNALALASADTPHASLGMRVLAAGESFSASMCIAVQEMA